MPISFKKPSRTLLRNQLELFIQTYRSNRKVARVVNYGGKNPRGYPAVNKCANPQFQSLIEEDCIRALDTSSLVSNIETHPFVLDIGDKQNPLRYTPDVLIWMNNIGALVEIKPAEKLKTPKVLEHLPKVMRALNSRGVNLVLLLDTDVRANGLQTELKELQRLRPTRGRYRIDLDHNKWDPRCHRAASQELAQRWKKAQQTCDELLARVMRRDPEDLFPTTVA